jgi:hypothetical protein
LVYKLANLKKAKLNKMTEMQYYEKYIEDNKNNA